MLADNTMKLDFSGKTAIVTGAAHGFGRAICQALAGNGATVWAVDIVADELVETERLCVDAGGRCHSRAVDITRPEAVQALVREIIVAPPVQDYAIRLLLATHPQGEFAPEVTNRYFRCGASPRGAQALILAAKVQALLASRYNVSFEDIRKAYLPAMRHRVLLNFEAQAENIAADTLLAQIIQDVPEAEKK